MKFIFLNLVLPSFVFFLSEPTFAVSPTTAALGMSSDQISIWDWSTNNFSYVFNALTQYSVYFLKDGRLAAQFNETHVYIWNLTTGNVDLTLECTGLVFEELYNGLFILGDANINVWNISSGTTLVKTININWVILYLKTLSISNLLAVSLDDSHSEGLLHLYDPANDFKLYRELVGHTYSISIIEELPNGNIITCSLDKTVKLWNITQSNFLTSIPFNYRTYFLKMISRDTFVLGGASNSIYIYKISSSNQLVYNNSLPIPGTVTQVSDIQVSKTNLVLIAFDDGSLSFYNSSNMELIKSYAVNNKSSGFALKFDILEKYHFDYEKPISTVESVVTDQTSVTVQTVPDQTTVPFQTVPDQATVPFQTVPDQTTVPFQTVPDQTTVPFQTVPDQTTVTDRSIWKQFIFLFDYTMGPSTAIVASFQIENRLKCLIVCGNDPSCRAVTFDNNNNCTMFSAYPPSNGESLISLIGTNLHYKF